MKSAFSGVIALGVLGALPLMVLDRESDAAVEIGAVKEAALLYELRINGQDEGCTIAKGAAAGAGRVEVEMAAECVALMPRLAEVRYWQKGGDGEVTFATADGRAVAEFYAADGVAYESLRPATPLMALIVQ